MKSMRRIIVSGSREYARNFAAIDMRWRQTGQWQFQDRDGRKVDIVKDDAITGIRFDRAYVVGPLFNGSVIPALKVAALSVEGAEVIDENGYKYFP